MSGSGSRSATSDAKSVLRRRIRAARRERLDRRDVEAEAVALADAVERVVAERTGGATCVVAAYVARPTEPPTHRLVEHLTDAGHRVILPVTRADLDLDWRAAGADGSGVPDAGPDAYLGLGAVREAAVIVVPALAVDRAGHRLGQGGGSYDRALARRGSGALVVALVHDDELLDDEAVPVDAHDLGVDLVVTPTRGAVSLTPPA